MAINAFTGREPTPLEQAQAAFLRRKAGLFYRRALLALQAACLLDGRDPDGVEIDGVAQQRREGESA